MFVGKKVPRNLFFELHIPNPISVTRKDTGGHNTVCKSPVHPLYNNNQQSQHQNNNLHELLSNYLNKIYTSVKEF